MEQTQNQVPRHIGIILDGNRRFAKRLMLKPWKGHEFGAEKTRKVLDWCKELGIEEVTLYAFSLENFDRPKEEFDYLMNLFAKEFNDLMLPENREKLAEDGLRINFIGRISMFPENVQKAMTELMKMTEKNSKSTVNFAMAYGGRGEIIDATKKIAALVKEGKLDVDKINEEIFAKQLYTESEPDLVIRTSGEQRTSGFMLWQASYAEFYFCPKFWPEFEKEDLVAAIERYKSRERRFGK
jgi:tritrans,polycis-undecaprenyl-diphosphate synthase [geranylgeranyl-diphosphate specific]